MLAVVRDGLREFLLTFVVVGAIVGAMVPTPLLSPGEGAFMMGGLVVGNLLSALVPLAWRRLQGASTVPHHRGRQERGSQ